MAVTVTTLTEMWDFIDKREIDKHVVSAIIMLGTVKVIRWAMAFAAAHAADQNTSIIIAAVELPYMALQAAAIQQYFKARSSET
jgi:hypothetical protein